MSPIWYVRILIAFDLVMIIHSDYLILKTALLKHLVSFLLVEGTAHPTISGLH